MVGISFDLMGSNRKPPAFWYHMGVRASAVGAKCEQNCLGLGSFLADKYSSVSKRLGRVEIIISSNFHLHIMQGMCG